MSDEIPEAVEGEDLRTTLEKIIDLLMPGQPMKPTGARLERRRREMRKPDPRDVAVGTGIAGQGRDAVLSRRQAIMDAVDAAQ